MTRTSHCHHRWIAALTVLPTLLAWGGSAKAESDEDEASPSAPASAPLQPIAELPPAPVMSAGQAPTTQARVPFIEEMGPETYPGTVRGPGGIIATLSGGKGIEDVFPYRTRGVRGGSLWLEPSFHGLQWPQNTRTGIGISGNLWVDSGYQRITRDLDTIPNSRMYFQQGRMVLRVTPAYVRGRFFIQGQGELVGNLCQTASQVAGVMNDVCAAEGTFTTDDLWIRVGHWNLWDLKIGRFQGWQVYHMGMGMDPYSIERLGAGMFMVGTENPTSPKLEAPTPYGVNYLHDRPSDGLAVGYAALHLYPTDYLRFELLVKLGADSYRNPSNTGATAFTYLGGRPTMIFDIGWFKLKVGAEYQKKIPVMQTGDTGRKKDAVEEYVQKGAGASVQFVADRWESFGFEFGGNAAIGKQEYTDTTANNFGTADTLAKNYTTKSFGGFGNLRLSDVVVGGGVNWTSQLDEWKATPNSTNDYTAHLQTFGAIQYLLANQLFIKAVLSYARAKFQASDISVPVWTNAMYSGRIRLMYLF